MNNYPDFKNCNYNNNYNYNNANLYNKTNTSNTLYSNENTKISVFDPYNGFIRGNMFKTLYDPYKLNEPYEVKPMNEQAELLTYINALCFAMTDLNLYLDIYSDDKNSINLFNEYRKEKEALTKEYESKYGPLTLNSNSLNSYPWAWDDMPWPWDN